VADVKKIRVKKSPLSAAAVKSLRDEFTRTVEPAQALAGERRDECPPHVVTDLVSRGA
jgi:hypothetical protein